MTQLGDLRLLAMGYDLADPEDRRRSAAALAAFYRDLVATIAPEITAEIGAFDATFSKEMKRRLPQLRAVAFEANPYNYEAMARAARAAGVDYVHSAVGEVNGAVTFNIQAAYAGQPMARVKGEDSLLLRTAPGLTYEAVTVPSTTADRFFSRPSYADGRICLWIDVEGASSMVLSGAGETLARTQAVLIEVEDYPHWSGQWLSGQVDRFLTGAGFTPVARDFEYETQYNLVYVREELTRPAWFDLMATGFYSSLSRGAPR